MTVWRQGYASNGGERIYWEAGGEGLTLVLCHGAGSNHVSFYNQMAGMASDEVRIVTWDQRGYGNSTCTGGAVGPRAAVSDLTAVLDSAGVTGPVHVVGQAMGAFVAAFWSLANRERVTSLAIWDGPFALDGTKERLAWAMKADAPSIRAVRDDPRVGITGAVSSTFVDGNPVQTYLYQTLQELGSTRPPYDEIFALIDADPVPIASLAELGAPMLIGRGEHDHVADPQAYEEIAARLPNAATVVLAGAGHSPYFEVPDQWNAVMLDYVRAAAAR